MGPICRDLWADTAIEAGANFGAGSGVSRLGAHADPCLWQQGRLELAPLGCIINKY